MWEPQFCFVTRLGTQFDNCFHHLFAFALISGVPTRAHDIVHERAHPQANVFDFGWKREINHVTSVPYHCRQSRSQLTVVLPREHGGQTRPQELGYRGPSRW